MKKNNVIFGLLALCSATGLLQAGPMDIRIANKSESPILSTKAYYAMGGEVDGEYIPAYDNMKHEEGRGRLIAQTPGGFKQLSIVTKGWWWGFGKNRLHTRDISSYQGSLSLVFDGTRIATESEYAQGFFQKLAAQLAAAKYLSKTRTWFNNIWELIKKTVNDFVTRATSVTPTPTVTPTIVATTQATQTSFNTTIKFKNESTADIALGATNPRLYIKPGATSGSYLLSSSLRHGNLSVYTGHRDNNQNFEIIKAFEYDMKYYIEMASTGYQNDELSIVFTGDNNSIKVKTQWQNPNLVIKNRSGVNILYVTGIGHLRPRDIIAGNKSQFSLETVPASIDLRSSIDLNQKITINMIPYTQEAKSHRGENLYIEVINATTEGKIIEYKEPVWGKKQYIEPKTQPTPMKQRLIIKNESNFKILYTWAGARPRELVTGQEAVWNLRQNKHVIDFVIFNTPDKKITANITALLQDAHIHHPGKDLYIEVKNSESPQRISYEAKWVVKK